MQTNGTPQLDTRRELLETLLQPLTEGYQAQIHVPTHWLDAGWLPQIYLLRDIEMMLTHPMIHTSLEYFKSGIVGAEFSGPIDPKDPNGQATLPICQRPEIADYVVRLCDRFWDRGMPKVQGGYEYGWIGLENMYRETDGFLTWEGVRDFSPRDTFLLTQDFHAVGVRVKNIKGNDRAAMVDLWLATGEVPAKGLWYVHRPRYSSYYGVSQLLGAWRPWRRVAWKDSAETVLDGGVYRYLYRGPLVRYPDEDLQVGPGSFPATALDSQGNPRRYSRDVARQIAEYWKTGVGLGLPSSKYPADMGGDYKWDIEDPAVTLDIAPALDYVKQLYDQIAHGIGVPPELIQAAETGTGYSGRSIPLEAFLDNQQKIADAMLAMFVQQVVRPLVAWNFGPGIQFEVRVKRLLESKRKAQAGDVASETSNAPKFSRMPGGGPGQAPGQRDQGNSQPVTPPMSPFSLEDRAARIREIAQKTLQRARAA